VNPGGTLVPIADIIESRRVQLGISQTELAQRVGTDARNIRRYESGQAQPTFAMAQSLAKVLGITLDELAGESPGWGGLWWSSWEGLGPARIQGPVELTHRGRTVEARPAGVRDVAIEAEDLRWEANLLADSDSLVGWFDLRNHDVTARGTLQLDRHGEMITGTWVKISFRQGLYTGKVGLGRTQEAADQALSAAIARQHHSDE
jgi:transcriptional regulator with XRE-family HTH domain